MTAFTLHLPERNGVSRWVLAGAAIVAAHAAIVASVALWYVRPPPAPNILPAISVSLAPVEASSPETQNQDIAVGPAMAQAQDQPKEEPKVEDKPIEQVVPPPQQQAEVTLPTEQKEVEKPKQEVQPARAGNPRPAADTEGRTIHTGRLQRLQRLDLRPSAALQALSHGGAWRGGEGYGSLRPEPSR